MQRGKPGNTAEPRAKAPTGPERFESEIRALEESERRRPNRPGGIVFVGSSSIKNWKTLDRDFPGLGAINRGFGGSNLPEATHFAPRIVAPLRPRQVVLYSGDNDISGGRTARELVLDFHAFVGRVRRDGPGVPIVFLAIKPSPSRIRKWPEAREANRRIADYCALRDGLSVVDVATPMLRPDGTPRPELYLSDQLHMTPEGYALWTRILAPHLLPAPTAKAMRTGWGGRFA